MPVLQLDNRREALAKEEAPCHLDLSKLIQAGTRTFFNNPALSDLTLVCPDGRALHCHSIILAAASRRFASALKQGNWTPGQQMPVKGVDSDALETLICAFYTAECPLELARVPALYDAAVKLEVPSLAPALEQYLGTVLQPHNCCQVLELCLNVGVTQLADLALEWIRGRISDVVPSPEFRSSRLETAAYICKDLSQRSQLVALQAAVSWLSAGAGRASLVGVFAEATGLSVDAIQAVAVSSAALGPMGHGGSLLQLSHGVHGHGLTGPSSSLLGPGTGPGGGPSLNLQQGLGLGPGVGDPPLGVGGLGGGLGLGLGPGGGVGGGSGAGGGVQVLQLLPGAGGSQAVLVMPPGGGAGGGLSGESGHPHSSHPHHLGVGGLQSLLSLHGGGGGGAGGGKGGGVGGLGGGGLGGPPGFGLDALADAAEGERVQKRLRPGGGGPLGPGGFVATAAESGSATSVHSDMSGGTHRVGGGPEDGAARPPPPQRLPRDADLALAAQQAMNHHPTSNNHGQQLGLIQPLQQPLQLQAGLGQNPRGKAQAGRSTSGRRKRGTSASDDDEDYAPSGGGRSGGGGGGGGSSRSRAQDLVYDVEALADGPAGGGGRDDGSPGPGDDDAGGHLGGGSGANGENASPKAGGAASGGSGGGGSGGGGGDQGNTPVLMTGRRAPAQKGMCHVQGCHRSLLGLRDYYQRYKICEHHLKVSSVLKDGIPHRFCQQCGRFHPLSEFDGDRRSCRTMLQRHCHRRAKQKQELAEVLAQRFEEKQVAASMSAVVAAMARNAQASSNVAGLSPMLQLQYLAGLPPAAAAAAAAALDEEQLGALGAAAITAATGLGGGGGSSDGSGVGGTGSGRGGRGSLPPGLHSPPSKAQLLEAVQRARKQHIVAQQQLLGLAAEGPLAAALAAAAAAAGNDNELGGRDLDVHEAIGDRAQGDDEKPGGGMVGNVGRDANGRGGGGGGGNGRYGTAMLSAAELGGGGVEGDVKGIPVWGLEAGGPQAGGEYDGHDDG